MLSGDEVGKRLEIHRGCVKGRYMAFWFLSRDLKKEGSSEPWKEETSRQRKQEV